MSPPVEAASSNMRAIACMIAGQASFTANDTLIKLATAELPGGQAIFMRGVMAALMALTACVAMGVLNVERLRGLGRLLVLRNIGEIGATFFFLFALFNMPIATTTAILQSMPLAITAGAAIFLGEPVGWRRWLATLVGFIGVLIIIRPGGEAFNVWSILAVMSVGFTVLRDLSTRRIGRNVPAILLVLLSAVTVTLAASSFSLFETWIVPAPRSLLLLLGSATFIIGGYYLMVDAMRYGDVAIVSPFRYCAILWAILAGLLMWGERPDAMALFGTGLVVAAGVYTFMRERRVKALAARSEAKR